MLIHEQQWAVKVRGLFILLLYVAYNRSFHWPYTFQDFDRRSHNVSNNHIMILQQQYNTKQYKFIETVHLHNSCIGMYINKSQINGHKHKHQIHTLYIL